MPTWPGAWPNCWLDAVFLNTPHVSVGAGRWEHRPGSVREGKQPGHGNLETARKLSYVLRTSQGGLDGTGELGDAGDTDGPLVGAAAEQRMNATKA